MTEQPAALRRAGSQLRTPRAPYELTLEPDASRSPDRRLRTVVLRDAR